jgi:uncharacterized protein
MHAQSVAPMSHLLGALSKVLTKAEAHCEAKKIDPSAILTARLFPDMFTFTRQVQLTTDFAKGAAARLAGLPVPSYEDTEVTFADLQARIAKTQDFLATVTPEMLAGAATREVTFKARGQDMTLPGQTYFSNAAQPNFFFHLATAYNILRHNGVELGKGDFIGR